MVWAMVVETHKKVWEVYIVRTESGKFYTGITTDLERRLAEHAGNKRGAKFFRVSECKELVFREQWENRSEATKREGAIKRLTHAGKIKLIGDKRASSS